MEDKEFSSINVIPLVDIMLVLLPIVLITATFIVQGSIPVNLPQAKSPDSMEKRTVQIVIDKEGNISFEEKSVSLEQLQKMLKDINRQTYIAIYADREVKLQPVVNVLDTLKSLGFEKAFIKTEVQR